MKLNQAQIQKALLCGQAIVFDEIGSTNEYLLTHHQTLENGSVCLAEKQTAGRGRRGRTWYSPESENLYFHFMALSKRCRKPTTTQPCSCTHHCRKFNKTECGQYSNQMAE